VEVAQAMLDGAALKAFLKRILSYRKRAWNIHDYPIRISEQKAEVDSGQAGRLKLVRWSAQIINWWQMSGNGETREEALGNLDASFRQFQATHEKLPRPGTGAPIEFASATLIQKHEGLAREFLHRILDLNLDECFISDESSLWDFHDEETNEAYYGKIVLLYNVDVSDVEGAKLGQILETIANARQAH
jgi:hypothetical protein